MAGRVAALARPGDLVLTMGIGDVHLLCADLLTELTELAERREVRRPGGPGMTGGLAGRLPGIRPARRWYAVAALLVLVLLAWLIGFSSVLGVRSVDVLGARTVTAAQVRAAAGIRTGTPLARLDLGAIRSRLSAVAPTAPSPSAGPIRPP